MPTTMYYLAWGLLGITQENLKIGFKFKLSYA